MDRYNRFGFAARLVGNSFRNHQLSQLALRPQIYSAHHRVSVVASGRCLGSVELLAHFRRNDFDAPLVRHCAGSDRSGDRGEAGRAIGGKIMTLWSLTLILISLITFVAGQLLLKRAMESTIRSGYRNARFISLLGFGIFSMTISFFLTLGLLQRYDLSYLYPFQGLSVIIISIAAAILLREKLTLQLTMGALLITAGIVLVSLT
jgi:uncharacterized membrane protein